MYKPTPIEKADNWSGKIDAALRVKKAWANRFKVETLYQYYEGYQWEENSEDLAPYIVNLIYSNIEAKLPNMLFSNPEYFIKPRPFGEEWDYESAAKTAVTKQDIINYVVRRKEFNLSEKHELAALDAFFGFGIIQVDYNKELSSNPYVPQSNINNPLNYLYSKHIPFDRFLVSARANWDLSEGRWWGYYEFVPYDRLEEYKGKLKIEEKAAFMSDAAEADQYAGSGKLSLGENREELAPSGTCKIWQIWDFEHMKYLKFCQDNCVGADRILEEEDFTNCNISILRYGKRRKGWYPLPPVFQWISPQDEINEVHQTMRIHRKRFKRKYLMQGEAMEPEEQQKLLYGPDGTIVTVQKLESIKALEDPPLDASNTQAMVISYDDFNRVAGSAMEQGRIQDRTTASQAQINERRAQIRESKELTRMGNFLVDIGYSVERSLRKAEDPFWVEVSLGNEQFLGAIQNVRTKWTKVPPGFFEHEDYELDVKVASVSPIYQDQDKKTFLEFMAAITQYEVLSFSPALLREAADKIGYRNEAVLQQFQQWAQLLAIGRSVQLQQQAGIQQQVPNMNAPTPQEGGQLPERQMNASTPPDNQEIMNQIFNRGGLQQ